MRRTIVLAILAAAALWGGGQNSWTAIENRQPTRLSIAEYAKKKPKAAWLELTGAALAINGAMHATRGGKMEEVYIPLVDVHGDDATKIAVLLVTDDPKLMNLYQAVANIKDEAKLKALLDANADKLLDKTVSGVVRYGIDLRESDRKQLAALDDELAPDFILLEAGKKPSLAIGLVVLALGLLLAALALSSLRSQLRRALPPALAGRRAA
jgi:hypothetical protein